MLLFIWNLLEFIANIFKFYFPEEAFFVWNHCFLDTSLKSICHLKVVWFDQEIYQISPSFPLRDEGTDREVTVCEKCS